MVTVIYRNKYDSILNQKCISKCMKNCMKRQSVQVCPLVDHAL